MTETIISVEKLTKKYDLGGHAFLALKGIDLQIPRGSYTAIMGPSGSGKSSLLNLLGCLDRPTSGQYFLGGEDVSRLNDDQLSAIRGKKLGFIFQAYNLIPQLNVVENIHVPLFYQGIDTRESYRHCEDLARMVGLGDRLHHKPKELSGGQQQRVAVARSLVNNPLLILADEPTGNLDSRTGLEILDLMDRLHSEGKTLILVTHGDEVAERAETVIHMKDGFIDRVVENVRRTPLATV